MPTTSPALLSNCSTCGLDRPLNPDLLAFIQS